MFTEDILPRLASKRDDRATVFATRSFVILVVAATFVLSLILPRSVFDLGLWSFAGFTGLFPLVFAAIYWRRLTAAGAIASVITMLSVWLVLFVRSDFGGNPKYGFPESPFSVGPATIPPLHPVVTVFVAATVSLVVVSLLSKAPEKSTLRRFFSD